MNSAAKAHVLIFDGYADWEIGNVLAEFHRLAKVDVVSVGFSDQAVVSMGGLRVIPDIALSEINTNDVLIFIMPGNYKTRHLFNSGFNIGFNQ
jgi:putative intracellular protease/amidase